MKMLLQPLGKQRKNESGWAELKEEMGLMDC